jgi:hypothetical protein
MSARREVARLEAPDTIRTTDACISSEGNFIADVSSAGVTGIWNLARLRARLAEMNLDWSSKIVSSAGLISPVELIVLSGGDAGP